MKLCLVLVAWWWCVVWAADHSIMEIINKDRVVQLIAQQRLNSTRQTPYTTSREYSKGSSGRNVRKKDKGSDDVEPANMATVLSEIGTPDRLLESDSGMLVTKKKFLKKGWCRTEPVVQTIREEGCLPKNIVNRFCYGQCNSFFIPMDPSGVRGRKKHPDEWEQSGVFRSCGVCKPKKSAWVQVTLECPGTGSPLRRRRVHKVKQCQCMAVNV